MKVAELATTIRDAITVSRVLAEPHEKDGVTVIAAATVAGGAGGGSAAAPTGSVSWRQWRAAGGARPRELIEAASSGKLDQALAAASPQAQQVLSSAAGEGFLEGLNAVLTLAALLSFAGALLTLWLVRKHEIQRQPMEPNGEPESDALPEAAEA
jgi:hypothetical protein